MKELSRRGFLSMGLPAVAAAAALGSGVGLVGCSSQNQDDKKDDEPRVPVEIAYDHVVDLGVITEIDFEKAEPFIASQFDKWNAGGCSAVAKVLDDGRTLLARNLDLSLSNKPAYIMRVALEGKYKAVCFQYNDTAGEDFEVIKEKGMAESWRQLMPILATDQMNEKGLYVEINMRNDEYDKDGKSVFGCSGTNPGGKRVCSANLPFYITQNCATVKEAVEYVKTLDVYSMKTEQMSWEFCFLMADATGDYGLLEIAQDKLVWHDKQPCQTNFYITEEFAKQEKYGCGLGRYDVLKNGIKKVADDGDMWDLINKVCYFQVYYDWMDLKFDVRSEFVNEQAHDETLTDDWTTEFVMDPKNAEKVLAVQQKHAEEVGAKTEQEIRDADEHWFSSMTLLGDCTNKVLKARFFEDNIKVAKLTFDF